MLFYSKPDEFNAKFEVGLCVVTNQSDILLLQRQEGKSEAGLWGVPAGKINHGEKPIDGAKRELLEETGLDMNLMDMSALGTLYDEYPEFSFIIHVFTVEVNTKEIKINSNEHSAYQWAEFKDALQMNLMQDVKDILQYVFRSVKAV